MEKKTDVKGSSAYMENIATMILLQISSLVLSVAVNSIKTFFVFKVIFEWSPFIIGGNEQTVRFRSYMTG